MRGIQRKSSWHESDSGHSVHQAHSRPSTANTPSHPITSARRNALVFPFPFLSRLTGPSLSLSIFNSPFGQHLQLSMASMCTSTVPHCPDPGMAPDPDSNCIISLSRLEANRFGARLSFTMCLNSFLVVIAVTP